MVTTTFDFSAFQSKYKYRIGGEIDSMLSRFGTITQNDDRAFRFLRASRSTEYAKINAINAAEPDESIAKGKAAVVKLDFLEKSARELNRVFVHSRTEKISAKSILLTISGAINEISRTVREYTENTTDSIEDQDAFLARAQAALGKLNNNLVKAKGNLRAEGTYVDVNLIRSKRISRETQEAIDNFIAARSAAASAPTDDGSVDITV